MPDFTRVINLAYERILGRPADSSGLQGYNQAMNLGLTEAQMRESLIRSHEYTNKNPDVSTVREATRASKKSFKKKATSKKVGSRKK